MSEQTEKTHLRFSTLTEVVDRVRSLQNTGYVQQKNWCLAETVDHLRKTLLAATHNPGFRLPWILRFFLRSFYMGKILEKGRMSSGIKTHNTFQPDPRYKKDAFLEEAISNFSETVRHFEGYEGEYLPNVVFGKLTRSQWVELQCVHCAHHLRHLQPVTADENKYK